MAARGWFGIPHADPEPPKMESPLDFMGRMFDTMAQTAEAKRPYADSGAAWALADEQMALAMRLSRSLLLEKLARGLRHRQEALWLSESREPTPIYDAVVKWHLGFPVGLDNLLPHDVPAAQLGLTYVEEP